MDYVDDGYPTEEALEMIEKWDAQDAKGFFEFVKSIWWMPNWGWQEEMNEEGNKEYHIATGGWSGNESIIYSMQRNRVIWLCTWLQSSRGGGYIFELRGQLEQSLEEKIADLKKAGLNNN
jgi:hypothetical protein